MTRLNILPVLAACAAASVLGGCMGGLPGTGPKFDFDKFVNNPGCDHTDKVAGVTGAAGIPASLQFEASRVCHAAPAVAPGVVVAPATGVAAPVPPSAPAPAP